MEFFWTHPLCKHNLSIIYILIVSKNGQFCKPPTQFISLQICLAFYFELTWKCFFYSFSLWLIFIHLKDLKKYISKGEKNANETLQKRYFKSFRTHTQAKNLKIGRKFELSLKSVVGKVSAFFKLFFLLFFFAAQLTGPPVGPNAQLFPKNHFDGPP